MTQATAQDPRIGKVLDGRYRVLEPLSDGAMGQVYRAEHVQLGRNVAVKFLRAELSRTPQLVERFEGEAMLMSRLDHPNCIGVIDYGVAESAFIVMDFVSGRPLDDVIAEGPMPAPRAIGIVRQILAGLAHAHELGIIHRDVKPENVMLTQVIGTGDHIRLLDFGIAKLGDAGRTMVGQIVGTPEYIAPEQAAALPLDGRADLYSTAAVLFELLTGRLPFIHDDPWELCRMHREDPPPRLAAARPELACSEALEEAVARGLSKDRDARFATPAEFAEALSATPEAGAPGVTEPGASGPETREAVATSTPTEAPRAPRTRRRRSGIRWLAGLAVLAAAGWMGWKHLPSSLKSDLMGLVDGADASSEQATTPVRTVADALALATRDREAAILALHELRRTGHDAARATFELGNLYMQKGWVSEAIAAYGDAIERDGRFRADEALCRNVLLALEDSRTRDQAVVLLAKGMGPAAIPCLKRSRDGSAREALKAVQAFRRAHRTGRR